MINYFYLEWSRPIDKQEKKPYKSYQLTTMNERKKKKIERK